MQKDLLYNIALSLITGIGSKHAKNLLAFFKTSEQIFIAPKKVLMQVPGIGNKLAQIICNSSQLLKKAEEEIKFIDQNKITPIFYTSKNYPAQLRNCEDGPIMLYVKGDLQLQDKKLISIVGTRNATHYGKEMCSRIITDFKKHGHDIVVISGLAYGIDICAHKAAIENNIPTIAVLGHGLHTIYPAVHKKYVNSIINNGALISEFHSFSQLDPSNFVKRNRIIAGMSHLTLVIESKEKGGALITADIANSYNKDVFALPGRSTDETSHGCNWLIKTNRAALIESASDIEQIMCWDAEKEKTKPYQRELFVDLSSDEEKIIEIIESRGKTEMDFFITNTGLPLSNISAILLQLEFKGLIKCLPGKIYDTI